MLGLTGTKNVYFLEANKKISDSNIYNKRKENLLIDVSEKIKPVLRHMNCEKIDQKISNISK